MRPVKENKAKKGLILSLYIISKYPCTEIIFSSKVIYTCGLRRKAVSLWGVGEKEGKANRRRKKEDLLSEPQMPHAAHSKLKCSIVGILRGKEKLHFFPITDSSLLHRPSSAKWKTAAMSSAEAACFALAV